MAVLMTMAFDSMAQVVLISEIDTNEPDALELTNVSGIQINISGWMLYVYERSNWPAPTTLSPGTPSFTFPPGTWLPKDGVVVVYDGNFTPPANAGYPWFNFGFNLAWNSGSQASNAVLLVDAAGNAADFFISQGVSANVSPADITVPFPITTSDWMGFTVGEQSNPHSRYHRAGTVDTNTRDDWYFGASSLGQLNEDLLFPALSPWAIEISLDDPDPTAGPEVRYTVTFSTPVTGVETGNTGPFNDFVLTVSSGNLTGHGITAVTQTAATTYQITANAGAGEGLLRLDILANGGIADAESHPMIQDHTTGPAYTVDTLPPVLTVDSKITADTTPPLTGTVADIDPAVTILVTIDHVNFFPAINHGDGTWSLPDDLLGPLAQGIYDVHAEGIDALGNTGVDITVFELEIFHDYLNVDAITRMDDSPTNAPQVRYQVVFSSAVSGVETGTNGAFDDFALISEGDLSGASISSVTATSDATFEVVVATGAGDGSFRLDVLASGGILNTFGFPLPGDATYAQSYVIERLRFESQPAHETIAILRRDALFSVAVAGGTPPYYYEWKKTTPEKLWLSLGIDAPELFLEALTYDDAGSYVCTVSDAYEVIVSTPAQLIVIPAVPVGGFVGLALLTALLAAAGCLVMRGRREQRSD
jgi:hypothetical protein